MDYCNGLLLGRGWGNPATGFESEYVVCNPATEEWIALPQSARQDELMEASLCFDPAVSPHFHVVELWLENDLHYASYITGLEVYSSETRTWVPKENGWETSNENREDPYTRLVNNPPTTVFLHGCLHLLSYRPDVAVVDMEGKTWRNIPIPGRYETDNDTHYGFIQQSQGRLHYAAYEKDKENGVIVRLVIYVLQDYDSQDWVMKHTVEDPNILTGFHWWVAMHPECNVVFYTALKGRDKTLMSYDMDHRRVQVICKLERDNRFNYVPYEPLYTELQALQM
jgi:F-box interacting protein